MDAHVPNFARKASKYTIPPPASPIPRIVLKSPTISSTTPPIQESKDYGLPPTTPTTPKRGFKIVLPKTPIRSINLPKLTPPKLTPSKTTENVPRFASTPNRFSKTLQISQTPMRLDDNRWKDESIWEEAAVSKMTKIVSLTPVGSVVSVPTSKIKPPPTRRLCHVEEAEDSNPIANVTMYMDTSNTNYVAVAEKMKAISKATLDARNLHFNTLYHLPKVKKGKVTRAKFEELLSIYENNQVYYQDELDANNITEQQAKEGLTELEHWFIMFVEPKTREDKEGVIIRERYKLETGYSAYCDKVLYPYITPATEAMRQEIRTLQSNTY